MEEIDQNLLDVLQMIGHIYAQSNPLAYQNYVFYINSFGKNITMEDIKNFVYKDEPQEDKVIIKILNSQIKF